MLETALLVVALIALLHLFVTTRYNYWKKRGIAYVEPKFPFGNIPDVCMGRQFIGEAFKELYDELKEAKVGGVFHIFRPVLIIRDPEEIRNVLTKDFESFSARDENMDRKSDFMSVTLFHMQDKDEWKNLRSKLTKTFSSSRMRQMFEEMVRCSKDMQDQIGNLLDKGGVECKDLMSDYTTNVAFACFFGLTADNNDLVLKDVREAVSKPRFITRLRIHLYNIAPWIPLWLRVKLMPPTVSRFFMRMAKDTVAHRESYTGIPRGDMFDQLLEMKKARDQGHSGKYQVDMDVIAAQCFLFYAAAYDSTAFTLSACLQALAFYPEIQKKLQEEVDRVIAAHGGKITYDAIQEMSYLEQVLSETLRLMPAVPELQRRCVKKYVTTTGQVIEPGVRVIIPVFAIQRDPKHYPDPEKFMPERFSEEHSQNRERYTYLPFGDGPRSCIGMRFGLLMAKVGLASIVMKYSMEPDPRSPFPYAYSPQMFVVCNPKEGCFVKFVKRPVVGQ